MTNRVLLYLLMCLTTCSLNHPLDQQGIDTVSSPSHCYTVLYCVYEHPPLPTLPYVHMHEARLSNCFCHQSSVIKSVVQAQKNTSSRLAKVFSDFTLNANNEHNLIGCSCKSRSFFFIPTICYWLPQIKLACNHSN